jgi:hypothetical protein
MTKAGVAPAKLPLSSTDRQLGFDTALLFATRTGFAAIAAEAEALAPLHQAEAVARLLSNRELKALPDEERRAICMQARQTGTAPQERAAAALGAMSQALFTAPRCGRPTEVKRYAVGAG